MTSKSYLQRVSEVEETLKTTKDGLTSDQVRQRLTKFGPNALAVQAPKPIWRRFLDQFKDLMIIVLIVAAILSGFVANEWTDAAIIMAVVILNAVLGVFQETRAEEAINALKKMATPQAHVRRDHAIQTIPSTHLVPGDIVLLEAGDVVPADLRLSTAKSLKIEESALTGESVPVEKNTDALEGPDVALGDRRNMAFMNANVTYGRGEGIVTATGMKTQVGQIATMINEADETTTPLQENLNHLGKILTILILAVAAIIFVVGLVTNPDHEAFDRLLVDMFLVAISLAVAAIPEGLPAIVTIILALGTQRMAQQKALVRKLPAVETLGATDLIASDKTGTLTQNKMTVEKVYYDGKFHAANEAISEQNPALVTMILANDAKLQADGQLIGDPTETALFQFALDHQIALKSILEKEARLQEVPFDSDRKLMSTVNQVDDQHYRVAVKGAPDVLLERVTHVDVDGKILPIDENQRQEILKANHEMAQQALRVLALAYKPVDQLYEDPKTENVETKLIFAGLVGMIDPERPEAKAAVKQAHRAGIRTIMITGDHQVTAQAIAERLGILKPGEEDRVLTGAQLDQLSDETFAKNVKKYAVYARVSPAHKVRIVKAWQKNGEVVAMTGDGVNDAPSLKQADIGVGMGITGTEVSKSASDMVLADDNFATIVVAVREGRKVFSNIQKAIQYLMSANLGEVLTVFVMTLLSWDILKPVQLLWINLVTDTLPAIALGVEPEEPGLMSRRPRGRKSNFFSGGVASSIAYQGLLEGALVLGVYLLGLHVGPHVMTPKLQHADALTMAYVTLGLIQLFHAFNSKSIHQSIFKIHPFANKWFNWSILISTVMLAVTILIPGLNGLFSVTELNLLQWGIVVAAGFLMIIIVELVKWAQRRRAAHEN